MTTRAKRTRTIRTTMPISASPARRIGRVPGRPVTGSKYRQGGPWRNPRTPLRRRCDSPVAARPSTRHSTRMQHRLVLACALAAVALVPACSRRGGAGTTRPRGEGTRRMAERLETIARETDPQDHPWLNTKRALGLRALVEQATSPREYLELMPRYAAELLRAARTNEAIKALQDLDHASTGGATNAHRTE